MNLFSTNENRKKNQIVENIYVLYFYIILLMILGSGSSGRVAAASTDTQFLTATSNAYQDIVSREKSEPITTDLNSIIAEVDAEIAAKKSTAAMIILVKNMPVTKQNVHLPVVQQIVSLALSLHNLTFAEKLLAHAHNQGDAYGGARISFEIAKYSAAQNKWDKVLKLLKNTNVTENLEKEDAEEANLLIGSALQQQKRHREAMGYYEKIKADSVHYRLAQLNLATANIRQDWWTDAHMAINNAIKKNSSKKDELDYRLHTLLGFSQIQFGFYRDARESFRNVSLKSDYTNRALLGLGMAALHQEDFIGALSAFKHLRTKEEKDISVAESYLLNAFTLRQLGQYDDALAAYQEAVVYYSDLHNQQTNTISNLNEQKISLQLINSIFIRPESRNDKQLRHFVEKINIIADLLNYPVSSITKTQLTNTKILLEEEYVNLAKKILRSEQESIASYLSQSKFGLATIYDGK